MSQHLARLALLVRDYDEAIAWFTQALGFQLVEDTPMTPEKRWVVVAPHGEAEMSILLARAANAEQRAMVGRQGGGRVFLFLHTDRFEHDYTRMRAHGVHFVEEPREETYGRVVVFEDLYGNRWDLVQRRT
jgi:catechol 2,3-dioxygenase-like lactoylglutathione lyase family enzyme